MRVRALVSSMPGVMVPARTLRKERRPFCGSLRDLKAKTTGRSSSSEMSSCSPLTSGMRPKSAIVGNHATAASMKEMTPSSRTQLPENTGTKTRSRMALASRPSSSSCVTSSPSRYFIMISSSASTTSSVSWARAASAASANSAGTSSTTGLPFSRWRAFMCTTSMMPLKASPEPMGMVTAPRLVPKRSWSAEKATSKSASGRSRRLMNSARERLSSSAAYHRRVVMVPGPEAASTTKVAVSQALMAA